MSEERADRVLSALRLVHLEELSAHREELIGEHFHARERTAARELSAQTLAGRIAVKRAALAVLWELSDPPPGAARLSLVSGAPGRYSLTPLVAADPAWAARCAAILTSVSHTQTTAYGLAVYGGGA